MAEHTFTATWNYCQFKQAKKNLEEGDVLIVNDFTQNYLCLHQNEPQGMHWEHKQVTLHPTMAYFKCPNSTCGKLCTHVKKFNEKTLEVLKGRKITICKIIHFGDHALSQYKNKTTFKYISDSKLCWMCNFFGVRHGKRAM